MYLAAIEVRENFMLLFFVTNYLVPYHMKRLSPVFFK